MPTPVLSTSSTTNNLIVDFPQEVTNALKTNKQLQPILHLEVKNVSCFYYMRKRLRPKRHSNIIIKFNANTSKYDGFIYDLKRREEDLKIAPKKCLISSGEDRWHVFKQCEEALKERDKEKPVLEEDDNAPEGQQHTIYNLATYLQITLVSECFIRIPPMKRLWMIYEALLTSSSLGVQVDKNMSDSKYFGPPQTMCFTSTFGPTVLSLPIFRFIPYTSPSIHPIPCHYMVNALTPSQWRPDIFDPCLTERLGQSRTNLTSLQIDPYMKPTGQKKRLQKLTTKLIDPSQQHNSLFLIPPTKNTSKSTSKNSKKLPNKRKLNESLGLDATVSGVKYAQLGGIYGHFFTDLSKNVQDMVLLRYADNKTLIRKEAHGVISSAVKAQQAKDDFLSDPQALLAELLAKQNTGKPKTNLSRLKDKQIHDEITLGEPDKGTNSLQEMKEHVLLSNRIMELHVIRIQRIRRMHLFFRIQKFYWQYHYAAITLQRLVRGYFARKYTFLLALLQPIAAIKIQHFYHAIKSYRLRKTWHYLTYRLTRVILPIIKHFIKCCYIHWMSKRQASAARIQTCIRIYIAKCKKYQQCGKRTFLQHVFPLAVIKIQAQIRRYLIHKWYMEQYIPLCLIRLVEIPATIRLQRIARGRLAKKQLAYLKYRYACLIKLQRYISAYIQAKWAREVALAKRKEDAVMLLQRVYRGHYDRKLYHIKYYFHWYEVIYIPNIIFVQSIVRRFLTIRKMKELKEHHKAAKRLQLAYRNHIFYLSWKKKQQEILMAFRDRAIIMLQRTIRRYLCMKIYQRKILIERGKRLYAAKLIYRAWKTYQYAIKWNIMLNEFRNQSEKKQIESLYGMKQEIRQDMKEIKHDLTHANRVRIRAKDRVKELDSFLFQAAVRLQKINQEMDKLTMDDFEQGWAEALGQEYEQISYQCMQAREEMRLLRHKIYTTEEEILALQLEYEEQEMELDTMDVKSMEVMQLNHLREIQTAETQARRHWQKMIFREKVHWKITSNRANRVARHRERTKHVIEHSKQGRTIDFYTTVDYEKKKQREDYEHFIQEEQFTFDASERDRLAKPKTYEAYGSKLQVHFDDMIAKNLQFLRGMTLDERGSRLRQQHRTVEVKKKKKRKGQFAALKDKEL